MWSFIEEAPEFVRQGIHREELKPGSMIVMQGFPEEDIYILTSGTIKVFYCLTDGTIYSVATAKEIDILGDAELLTGHSVSLNMAEALEPCELYRLKKSLFLRWLKADAAFCFEVLRLFAIKYDESARRWKYGRGLTLSEQMILWFYQHKTEGGVSKQRLSEELMAPVRSINRAVRMLVAEGLLCLKDGQVFPADRTAITTRVQNGKLKNYL